LPGNPKPPYLLKLSTMIGALALLCGAATAQVSKVWEASVPGIGNHFFYTSPSFPFPYLYDFSLNTVLYYFPDPNNPGHYTTNPRYFYNFATGQIITM